MSDGSMFAEVKLRNVPCVQLGDYIVDFAVNMVLSANSHSMVLSTDMMFVSAFRKALVAHMTVIMLGCWFRGPNFSASLFLQDETLMAILFVLFTVLVIVLGVVLKIQFV